MKTYSMIDYGAIEADLLQTSAIQAAVESPVFLDAENFSLLELTNVRLKGYDHPRLVIRSEGQVIVEHCDDFESVREAPGQSGIQGN